MVRGTNTSGCAPKVVPLKRGGATPNQTVSEIGPASKLALLVSDEGKSVRSTLAAEKSPGTLAGDAAQHAPASIQGANHTGRRSDRRTRTLDIRGKDQSGAPFRHSTEWCRFERRASDRSCPGANRSHCRSPGMLGRTKGINHSGCRPVTVSRPEIVPPVSLEWFRSSQLLVGATSRRRGSNKC